MTEGTTRRELMVRAGVGGAALWLGAGGAAHAATAPVRYAHGYNDDFLFFDDQGIGYANAVAQSGGRYIRTGIGWERAEPAQGSYRWESFARLKRTLQDNDLMLLPVFIGCPSWAEPSGPAGAPPHCSERYDDRWGEFVARGLQYFGDRVTVGEIWNESNLTRFGAVPARRFERLIQNAWNWVWAYNDQGLFVNGERRGLVTGGLSLLDRENAEVAFYWKDYLASFQSGIRSSAGYNVGIHCYDLTRRGQEERFRGIITPEEAALAVRRDVLRQFDEAKELTERNLWVTETGCASREPWNEGGQAQALSGIMAGFNQRGRCRGVFVHRLFDNTSQEPGGEPPNPFYRYGTRYGTERGRAAKSAYAALKTAWTEQPV